MLMHYFCDLDTVHLGGTEVDCHSATLTVSSSGANRQGWTVEFLRASLNDRPKTFHPVPITIVASDGQVMSGMALPDSPSSFRGIGQLQGWPSVALAG